MGEDKNLNRIAELEFQNDQLVAELEYIDTLLRSVGFAEGLSSLKLAAQDLMEFDRRQELLFGDGMPDEPPGLV